LFKRANCLSIFSIWVSKFVEIWQILSSIFWSENQQLYKENDKLTKHVYTLEEQLASRKNETESTDEESTSSETTVVPHVPTSCLFKRANC
jgi:hypothetical protein